MKTILAITLAIVATANADKITIALKSGGTMTGTLVGTQSTISAPANRDDHSSELVTR